MASFQKDPETGQKDKNFEIHNTLIDGDKNKEKSAENLGLMDRFIRMAVGLFILSLMYVGSIGSIGWFGAVPLVMGMVSWCPFYAFVGFSTCRTKKA